MLAPIIWETVTEADEEAFWRSVDAAMDQAEINETNEKERDHENER